MLHKNAKVELLKGVPLFSGCSRRQLGEIAAIANEVEFASGQVLIYERDLGGQFFVIIDGDVEVTKEGERVEVLGGKQFFGEMSLLLSGPTNATVTATSPGRALAITNDDLRRLMQLSPKIDKEIRQSLEQRLAPEMMERLTFWIDESPSPPAESPPAPAPPPTY